MITLPNDNGEFTLGSTVQMRLKIRNEGNVDLKNLIITSEMIDLTGAIKWSNNSSVDSSNNYIIKELKTNQEITVDYSYTVQDSDHSKVFLNKTTVTSNGETLKEWLSDCWPIQRKFKATFVHKFEDGTIAHPEFITWLKSGEEYVYKTPLIKGYVADYSRVTIPDGLNRDAVFQITYFKNQF